MSRFNIIIAVMSLLALHTLAAAAAQLSLTADPSVVMVGLTDTLTMRCSVLDATLSEASESSTVSNTSMDIDNVRSIIVYRGEVERETLIARLIGSYPAEAIADKENLQAGGVLSPNVSTGPNYLEMVWTEPGKEQSGQYTCRSHVLDTSGRGIVLQVKADIKVEEPGIPELTAEIMDLENLVGTQEKTINEMKQARKSEIMNLENQVGNETTKLENRIDSQEKAINNMIDSQEKTNNYMKKVLKPPHTEHGEVMCSTYTNDWRVVASNNHREADKLVRFQKPYTDIPVVSAAFALIDTDRRYNARFWFKVRDVSRTGFKITCGTWDDSITYQLEIRWTSTVA